MRDILFRGKAKNRDKGYHRTKYKNGDWVYGLLTRLYDESFENLPAEMTNEDGVRGIEIECKTIGQYTGLTDKNGTKIFEGDVIKIEHSDYAFDGVTLEHRTEQGIVAYDNIGSIGIVVDRYNGENVWSDFFHVLGLTGRVENWSFEIIGNIHDNPELLKGENDA